MLRDVPQSVARLGQQAQTVEISAERVPDAGVCDDGLAVPPHRAFIPNPAGINPKMRIAELFKSYSLTDTI